MTVVAYHRLRVPELVLRLQVRDADYRLRGTPKRAADYQTTDRQKKQGDGDNRDGLQP